MRRTLIWSIAMSTLVAAAITFMLHGGSMSSGQREHGIEVVVSFLGRSVTIGVSIESRDRSPSPRTEYLGTGAEAGEVP